MGLVDILLYSWARAHKIPVPINTVETPHWRPIFARSQTVYRVRSFPLGVATAVYLEEIAPKNRMTEIIEIDQQKELALRSLHYVAHLR